MGRRFRIRVEGGAIQFVYEDELADVLELGVHEIHRVSFVEPWANAASPVAAWHADMSPVGGPKLGPFQYREQALEAEREWLAQNRGL